MSQSNYSYKMTGISKSNSISEQGKITVSKCDFLENHLHGISVMNTLIKVENSNFSANFSGFSIYLPSSEQQMLLRLELEGDAKKYFDGLVGGNWGSIKHKSSATCCGCTSRPSSSINNDNNTKKCGMFS